MFLVHVFWDKRELFAEMTELATPTSMKEMLPQRSVVCIWTVYCPTGDVAEQEWVSVPTIVRCPDELTHLGLHHQGLVLERASGDENLLRYILKRGIPMKLGSLFTCEYKHIGICPIRTL